MPEIPPLPRRGLRCAFFPGARGTWSLPSFRYDWLEEGSMPVPFMQPMTHVVDCIHNATKTKNQDEISFPGGKPEPSVEKFCRKIPRCVRDKGCAPTVGRRGSSARSSSPSPCRVRRRYGICPAGEAPSGKTKRAASRPRKGLLFYSRGSHWSKGSWRNFLFPPPFP